MVRHLSEEQSNLDNRIAEHNHQASETNSPNSINGCYENCRIHRQASIEKLLFKGLRCTLRRNSYQFHQQMCLSCAVVLEEKTNDFLKS